MFLPHLLKKYETGEKLATLTCYDAAFAAILEQAEVDMLLVGDSVGMTVQGHQTTLPVTLDQMAYHTEAVRRGASNAFMVADLPFGSYQASPAQAYEASARLMAAGANMVKLEGGSVMLETVEFISRRGIPICAHLGLLPQSVNQTGYRAQGRDSKAAQHMFEDASNLEEAGAGMLVLESIPALLASEITNCLHIPTIGIGAGPVCDGQVLVLYDVLGLTAKPPRFARNFMESANGIEHAVRQYVAAVKAGEFPGPEHSF